MYDRVEVRTFRKIMADKEHAYELIDRLAPAQLAAVVGLLEAMLDPLARTLANAPFDDEPVSDDEAREVAASRAAFGRGEGISHEQVLAEFGLSTEDFSGNRAT
jgi:hypothetical protein